MSDALLNALPLAAGLLALPLAPAVDRWWERFDAWVEDQENQFKAARLEGECDE